MFCENELEFLSDILRKNRITAKVFSPSDSAEEAFDISLGGMIKKEATSLLDYLPVIEEKTVYKMTDGFLRSFIYFALSPDPYRILVVGPFLTERVSRDAVLSLFPQKKERFFSEYYASLPLIKNNGGISSVINAFCERLWETPFFSTIDLEKESFAPPSPITKLSVNEGFEDTLHDMRIMEKRYAFENELMEAVEHGQIHKEEKLLSVFFEDSFEKRSSDPLRNFKNYAVIMNTLLRKSAERGGVHPLYLDRVSSGFAFKIESVLYSETAELMREMFRSYCRLVRRHSMKSFSLVVQKAVLLIDSDVSANLTLSSLAKECAVSAGYLATVFKKETGKTVSEYIKEKRIKHAKHLLLTTHLQVQTVAQHCGIIDVQYFSKLFKKEVGKTPNEYRKEKVT